MARAAKPNSTSAKIRPRRRPLLVIMRISTSTLVVEAAGAGDVSLAGNTCWKAVR